ncbi:HAMP domain-containing histidine kinase [Microbispora sp. NBC_01189]|uniref:sensor histidine kinase n=1 Tax=Microbispora sp. NBC_01189 TaxID=2903583 RepID=UPI002E168883|nr:HAMP domain-containing histidine kinase [Microbispora sp. NBC_01189]
MLTKRISIYAVAGLLAYAAAATMMERRARKALAAECDRLRWFAADLSHELRTPLTAVRLELEDAVQDAGADAAADVASLTERLLPSLDRAEAVVTSMLLLTGRQAGDEGRELVDLSDLVGREVASRRDPYPVTVRLSGQVNVSAVREQMRQVLTNLLDNAQRYARRGVVVEVSRHGGFARMLVDDDGDGVPEADRRRVFQRFTRLGGHRDHDGGGLGLVITRVIAEAHRGSVEVEEAPSGGARFVLRLPAA